MEISIIGYGFVGKAVCNTFSKKSKVHVFDILFKQNQQDQNTFFYTNLKDCIFNKPITFVCLPTPMFKDNSCDTSIIFSVLKEMEKINYSGIVVIKSTLVVSFFKNNKFNLKILVNPEFLTEKNANKDFENQTRIFIGGKKEYANILKDYYLFQGYPKEFIYIEEKLEVFQLVKYFNNCFLASKVALFNEYYNIVELFELDYSVIRKYICLDSRITESHTFVPNNGKFGFGGNCFIKDTFALQLEFPEQTKIIKTIIESNIIQNKK